VSSPGHWLRSTGSLIEGFAVEMPIG